MAFEQPLGSSSPEVLAINAKNLDKAMNGDEPHWYDRFDVKRNSLSNIDNIITSLDVAGFTFDKISSGLEGTTNNQYFRVPQGEGADSSFIYYKNIDGSAVEVAAVPSAYLVYLIRNQMIDVIYRMAGIFHGVDFPFEIVADDGGQAIAVDKNACLIANNGVNIQNGGMSINGTPIVDLPENSEYAFAFGDDEGRVVIGIGKDSFVEILGIRFYRTAGENLIEIVDSNMNVSSGIDKNGRTFSNSSTQNNNNESLQWLAFAEVLHIVIYGQSLSIGQYGTPVLNTPGDNGLMFNTGIRSYGQKPTTLTALRETVSGSNGETMASTIAHSFTASAGDMAGRNLIFNSAGVGGITVEALSKGTEPYNQLVNHLLWVENLMSEQGRDYAVDFMLWAQGEADMANGNNSEVYKQSLNKLRSDLESDTNSMRVPGRNLVLLTYQTSSHGYYVGSDSNPPELIAQAQLEYALTDPYTDMWGPTYMGLPANHSVGQGNVHHNAHGYRLMALYAQKALRHRIRTRTVENKNGEKYLPVHAISARKLNNRTVLVDVFTYYPPLVIDSSYVSELADENHGVELHDDSGRLSITSVEITAGTKIKITSENDIGDGAFVAFAWTPENRGGITNNRYQQWFFGRETGVRTTIHDSDPEITDLIDETGTPYPLFNYLPIQKIAISA